MSGKGQGELLWSWKLTPLQPDTTKESPEIPNSQIQLAKLMIWAIPFFWTVNHIVARKAPGVITPHVLAICRWALVGIFLAWLARVELKAHWDILRTQVWRYILLGALGMWVCGAGVYQAGISTKMVNISLIYASSPVMIAVCSVLWLREPFSKRQALGVFIAILGVVHVVVQGEWARLAQVELVPGDLWILAASLAWAAYSLLQKHWSSTLSAGAQLACSCAGGVLVMVPFALWEFLQADTPALGHDAFMLIALAALFPGLGAYWLYGWVQKTIGASRVAMTLYLGPLYASVMAWVVLGEGIGLHHVMGGVLILSGVGLVMSKRHDST